MIKRLQETTDYNPISPHIRVSFTSVKDYSEKFNVIITDLINKGFDPLKSRVLVFVSSRKKVEEASLILAEELKNRKISFGENVDYYHAGLEGSEREEKFENYKNGDTAILIATKAFGMGMDISNVHFIYHLEPSSNFEDFLQEVGRAARNKESYEAAGFSIENPIITKCIVAVDDFKVAKDKLHNNQMTWSHLIQVQTSVYDYINKFSNGITENDKAFALPTDLLEEYSDFDGNEFDETFFRVALYWLEKLNKLKLGVYTPTNLPIKILDNEPNYSIIKDKNQHTKIIKFVTKLKEQNERNINRKGAFMIEVSELKTILGVNRISEVWQLLFLAQKSKCIEIERVIKLESTTGKKEELEAWSDFDDLPIIETVFDFAQNLMLQTEHNEQTHFIGRELDSIASESINSFLKPNNIFWENTKKKKNISKEDIVKNLRSEFIEKRAKTAFKLIEFLPKGRQKSILQFEKGKTKPIITQLIFNGYEDNEDWISYLNDFKKDLYSLIKFIHTEHINSNISKFNITALLVQSEIEEKGEQYFKKLLFIAKGLGYLKGNAGGLVPMGIELFVLDKSIVLNDNLNQMETSIREEFENSIKMKELRLLALEGLASSVPIAKHDAFIKAYFKCKVQSDLIKLLEEYFGEEHKVLVAFRAEALQKAIERLNPDQKKVYNEHISSNLQVIAGPGSGKTHTLTLRVARLVQKEKANPKEILILAYNRAVVVELKDRLNKLFKELGYSKLIKQLKVFTFHGFCKYTLGDELENSTFDEWDSKFLEIAKKSPGKISQKLGVIKFVFVDEFQDITSKRLELLKFIANPKRTRICVIGDPNQSIYGYSRVKEGGEMNPQQYYNDFAEIYSPKEDFLSINYRSYSQILEKSDELLSINSSKFEMPPMEAFNEYKGDGQICEFFDLSIDKTDWRSKLIELVNSVRENGEKYQDIAVMFRSNQEVYRAYNDIRALDLSDIQVRVQGAKGDLSATREFHYFKEIIKDKNHEILPHNFFELINELKEPLLVEFSNWDKYLINVFLCIVLDYKKERDEYSTYEDLNDFINEVASKDDGQFGKIYQQNIHQISNDAIVREIVITTMHKVKGIEYDAVLIPPSFSNLPQNIDHFNGDLDEFFQEERRLYYVAYTRAKYKLVVIKWKREKALDAEIPVACEIFTPEQIRKNLGIHLKEGIDKFTLYWGASKYGNSSFGFLQKKVQLGDELSLKKYVVNTRNGNPFNQWRVSINGIVVSQLSQNIPSEMINLREIKGFIVSSIYVHTYEQTINSETGAKYAAKWTDEAKKRGFIYLIDFSGYGKILN